MCRMNGKPLHVAEYTKNKKRPVTQLLCLFQNETVKYCGVKIIDDSLYEGEESFQVNLSPLYGGRVNKIFSKTSITITEDINDGK